MAAACSRRKNETMSRSEHKNVAISLIQSYDIEEWSASRLVRFILDERTLSSHWIGGCVGLRAGLEDV
jgi:hypothetical protein